MPLTYRCPYCGATFADAIAKSQHVRRCPDGPPTKHNGRIYVPVSWSRPISATPSGLPPRADRALQRWLRNREQAQAGYAATAAHWSGPKHE